MQSKRIVITGVGVISSIGIGKDSFWDGLKEGRSGIKPITQFDVSKYKVNVAGEISDFDPQIILGKKGLLDLDRASKLCMSSAKLALDDAQLEINESNGRNTGVVVGTTLGSLNSISRFNQQSYLEGPRFTNPSLFPSTVVSSPASRVGIRFKITGFNSTISTGMCSFIDALEYACDFISLSRVDCVLVGGVEDLSCQAFLGAYKLKILSGSNRNNDPISSPFDKSRDGFVLGEGATTLIIESLESAKKRKAKIYAEILGTGSSFDPGRYYKFSSDADGMVSAMQKALDDARLKTADITCIYTNANSSVDGDKFESKAIKRVFKEKTEEIYLAAIKSNIGETFSASGGMSLAGAVASLNQSFIPKILNYKNVDSDCLLKVVKETQVINRIGNVMINTFSPSGTNSVAIIGKFQE